VFGILTGCISDVTSRFETHSVTWLPWVVCWVPLHYTVIQYVKIIYMSPTSR